jgi:hypothetical protein
MGQSPPPTNLQGRKGKSFLNMTYLATGCVVLYKKRVWSVIKVRAAGITLRGDDNSEEFVPKEKYNEIEVI